MKDKIKNYIKEKKLITRGDTVLVALSGGADSVALLLLLCEIRGELGFNICAAHVDHMIRGDEAVRDCEFCRELCKSREVEFMSKRIDVPAAARENGQSLETAARLLRYEFLKYAAQKFKASKLATAHHMNDSAESMLLHLFRGTGLRGLTGISPCSTLMGAQGSELLVIRPLLAAEKREILDYLAQCGESYMTDSTNFEEDAARNKLRLRLLPYVEENINPRAVKSLCAASELLRGDYELILGIAREKLSECRTGENRYDRKRLAGFSEPLVRRMLMLALENAGARVDIEQVHVLSVQALLTMETGASFDLPGIRAYNEYGDICFAPPSGVLQKYDFLLPLDLDGVTKTPLGDFYCRTVSGNEFSRSVFTAYMDAKKLCNMQLCVRTRRDGDRISPFGSVGTKKLKDYFIDKKVPRALREIPLVCHNNEVIFAPGFCVSDKVKVENDTTRMLVIDFHNTCKGIEL